MFRTLRKFLRKKELAQDVAEYCLLTALLALVALGIFYRAVGGMDGIWSSLNTTLSTGASGPPTGAGTTSAASPRGN